MLAHLSARSGISTQPRSMVSREAKNDKDVTWKLMWHRGRRRSARGYSRVSKC